MLYREELLALGNHRYGSDAHFDDSGYIAITEYSFQSGYTVHIWDDTLTYINKFPLESPAFAFGTDGVFLSNAEIPMAIQMIDISTGEVIEEYSFQLDSDFISGIYAADESSRFDFYIHTIQHLYGFDLEAREIEHVLDFFESNLNLSSNRFLMSIGPEDMIVIAQERFSTDLFDFSGGEVDLSILKPVHRTALEDIERVVLAGFGFSNPFIDQVMDYNRRNPFQQIIIRDYFSIDIDAGYEEAIVQFHFDLLTGTVPDIIWIDVFRSIDLVELREVLISQGYLADLYSFIDSDQMLSREDFFPNILKGYENASGELPVIGNRLLVSTMVSVDPSITDESWTANKFLDVMESTIRSGNTEPLGSSLTGSNFALTMVELMSNEFINHNTGDCYFDSETFIHLLEAAAIIPANPDFSGTTWNIHPDPDFYKLLSGEQSVDLVSISMLHGWIVGEEDSGIPDGFNFEYEYIGIPSASGGVHKVYFPQTFSIFQHSQNKNTAWQFVREILLPNATGTFPRYVTLRIDDFKAHINASSMSADKEDILWDMINTASVHRTMNGTLLALIAENVNDFINGRQTAEEAARIIQSRVTIYLSEQR
jgi:hypothetical protein